MRVGSEDRSRRRDHHEVARPEQLHGVRNESREQRRTRDQEPATKQHLCRSGGRHRAYRALFLTVRISPVSARGGEGSREQRRNDPPTRQRRRARSNRCCGGPVSELTHHGDEQDGRPPTPAITRAGAEPASSPRRRGRSHTCPTGSARAPKRDARTVSTRPATTVPTRRARCHPVSSHATSATAHATDEHRRQGIRPGIGGLERDLRPHDEHDHGDPCALGIDQASRQRDTRSTMPADENTSEGSRSATSECPMTPFENHRMR